MLWNEMAKFAKKWLILAQNGEFYVKKSGSTENASELLD
jgi:hypothetical protein